jgi:hypothetical protein
MPAVTPIATAQGSGLHSPRATPTSGVEHQCKLFVRKTTRLTHAHAPQQKWACVFWGVLKSLHTQDRRGGGEAAAGKQEQTGRQARRRGGGGTRAEGGEGEMQAQLTQTDTLDKDDARSENIEKP